MEWIERLNRAMDCIEEHLGDEISCEELGKICCCSTYHFQRMFGYMAGMPFAEYVRRRRMSLAAVDLQAGEKIIDVALRYGYSSPTAFNRAFRSVHGLAPSAMKKAGVSVRSYPPLRFTITVKGVQEMNYRIEKKDAFPILGRSFPMSTDMEDSFREVPRMWQTVAADGTLPRLVPLMEGQPQGVLGVCGCGRKEELRYYIGVASSRTDTDFEAYTVPAFTWAVFPGEGVCPAAIQELEKRIITEWLPTSGYEYANGPDVELYLSPDASQAKFEVWIPVVKK